MLSDLFFLFPSHLNYANFVSEDAKFTETLTTLSSKCLAKLSLQASSGSNVFWDWDVIVPSLIWSFIEHLSGDVMRMEKHDDFTAVIVLKKIRMIFFQLLFTLVVVWFITMHSLSVWYNVNMTVQLYHKLFRLQLLNSGTSIQETIYTFCNFWREQWVSKNSY